MTRRLRGDIIRRVLAPDSPKWGVAVTVLDVIHVGFQQHRQDHTVRLERGVADGPEHIENTSSLSKYKKTA